MVRAGLLQAHADDRTGHVLAAAFAFAHELAQRIGQQGLTVRPLSACCLQRQDLRGLVIGYGYAPLTEIARCGRLLADLVDRQLLQRSSSA